MLCVIFTKIKWWVIPTSRCSEYGLCYHFLILSLDLWSAYQSPSARSAYLNDTFHGALIPGVFVTVCLSNHRKVLVTGKVVEVLENEFGIHYSKGSHACKILRFALVKYSRVTVAWKDVLQKHLIIVCDFDFDNQSKLSKIHWAI